MAPNTATAGKSYAQKAADLFMTAVGMKSATKPEPKEDAFAEEKLNPVASANLLAERCRQYLSNSDVQKIREAFRYADQAHLGQFRNSGAPYITHPIAVAEILASWHMDAETIEAGLMHDVLEDTGITKIEMSEKFGVKVAELVDGVSKLDKLKLSLPTVFITCAHWARLSSIKNSVLLKRPWISTLRLRAALVSFLFIESSPT